MNAAGDKIRIMAGVMGWPVAHSLSPRVHGYWLKYYGIEGSYEALAVAPEKFGQSLRGLFLQGFAGVNLTIPHKEAALKLLDRLDPPAIRIGAVNTVVVHKDGTLEGRNSDAFGFTQNLAASGFQPANGAAVVLGAGGAARAVIIALIDMGFAEIRIVNRTASRATALVDQWGDVIKTFTWNDYGTAFKNAGLLVNTTSLGMQGQPALDLALDDLPRAAAVTDLVYAPLATDLLRRAQERGHKTVDGLGMLLHQAQPGFEAWYGVKPAVTPELRRFVLEGA